MWDGKKMKNKIGPSLYCASDKNIFDALTRNRVNAETMQELFLRRNIIVSTKTDREHLADYFSRLPHDLADHRSIALRLDSIARKERLTSMELKIESSADDLAKAINAIKEQVEVYGDVVQVSRDSDRLRLNLKYSVIDYKKSEFSQVQVRDGIIEIIKTDDGYLIRNNHNEHINNVRESLISAVEKQSGKVAERKTISLFHITDPTVRSKFFHSLMHDLPGFSVKDVHEVYVFKARPDKEEDDDDEDESDSHVERVMLRGNGVTRSIQLNRLLSDDKYYVVRVAWVAVESKGHGQRYEIEARFEDPKDCTGFSFLLRGVYAADPLKQYEISTKRRLPTLGEVDEISKAIEAHAKALHASLRGT
jgi:hypothetical protein